MTARERAAKWYPFAVYAVLSLLVLTFGGRSCDRPSTAATREAVSSSTTTTTAQATTTTARRTVQVATKPSGERVETTTDEHTTTDAHAASARAERVMVRETVTVTRRASWRAGLAAGWDVRELRPRPSLLQLDLARRVAGPVWVGAWARSDRTAGLSLAVEW
jgi:hypothetical protein